MIPLSFLKGTLGFPVPGYLAGIYPSLMQMLD
jgi:hypothetical protein